MPFCLCGDINLYYEIHGSGLPLLLVSGLSGGTWSWYGQVPYFRKSYQTIVFDNRGAGRSSLPPGPYDMRQLAAEALCLLDSLGVDRALVMGLSMGGMIAQELALLAPQRVLALVLGCTHCGGDVRISPSPRAMGLLMNNEGLTQRQILEKNLPLFFSANCLEKRPETISAYIDAQLQAPLQPDYAFAAQLAAIRSFDTSDRLHQLRIPTLIVTGTEDVLIPDENTRLLAERIDHADVVEIQGAGHALHAECPEVLNNLAGAFFLKHANSHEQQVKPRHAMAEVNRNENPESGWF
jgi:3-oxoadipate enol-lactonase